MVLIDASSKWSHVCLLLSRNIAFARLIAQIIRLRAQFLDYPIKKIRLDNANEFTSQVFDSFCTSLGIDVEHPVAHEHPVATKIFHASRPTIPLWRDNGAR